MNRRPVVDSDEEGDEDDIDVDGEKDSEEDTDGGVGVQPGDLPPSDDEEEMAEIRRKVLQSKSFANPTHPDEKPAPQRIAKPQSQQQQKQLPEDSDAESGSDIEGLEDDRAFDSIINATPVTDRTGIAARQRAKGGGGGGGAAQISVGFSRTTVGAPKHR